jgi:curved DNA-binding protein CbpA
MAYPDIKLGSSFDAKGFKQAETATQKLTKSVKTLAGAFGLAFSTRAIVNFSKASVKAFAEDDAAVTVLRQNLKNLGLAYASASAETFIADLEKQTAIFDDELRPAYSKLAKVTLSTAKTQELMALAVDLARSNGLEFSTVINTLSKAYIGNYKGLKQLNIGLTDAELKTKDFAEIQAILIKQSTGAGKAYIETFAGSIDKLAVASANAKEIIGEGLVDAFVDLAGNGDIEKATDQVITLATAVSDLLKDLDKLTLLDYFGAFVTGSITQETFDKLNMKPSGGFTDSQNAARLAEEKRAKTAAAKAAAARAAELKAAKALAAAKIRADKLAAANKVILAKADSMFNIDRIQIEAALKGKISDNERLRLELQKAILNEDFELADKLQKKLEASQQAIGALQGQLAAIKPPTNPFADTLETLENIAELLAKISSMPVSIDPGRKGGGILALEPEDLMPLITAPKVTTKPTPAITEPIPVVVVPSPTPTPSTNNPFAGLGGNTMPSGGSGGSGGFGFSVPGYTYTPPPVTVNVTVEGNVLDGDDFIEKVNDAVLSANRTGLPRTAAGFLVDTG